MAVFVNTRSARGRCVSARDRPPAGATLAPARTRPHGLTRGGGAPSRGGFAQPEPTLHSASRLGLGLLSHFPFSPLDITARQSDRRLTQRRRHRVRVAISPNLSTIPHRSQTAVEVTSRQPSTSRVGAAWRLDGPSDQEKAPEGNPRAPTAHRRDFTHAPTCLPTGVPAGACRGERGCSAGRAADPQCHSRHALG